MYHRTAVYINLTSIRQNIMAIKKKLKPDTKLLVVLKADGYGHGAVRIAQALDGADEDNQEIADAYGVAIVEEGTELRKAGIKKPVLLLGYTVAEQMSDVVRYGLTQTVFTFDMAAELSRECIRQNRTAEIHVKLDTGMGRIGFQPDEASIDEIIRISQLEGIRITGLFSHLARADEADKSYAYRQFRIFTEFADKLEAAGLHIPIRHISNSAAAMELGDMQLDMVRFGIGTYGLYPSAEVDRSSLMLEPAMEWKSHVSYVKELPPGCPISYGGIFVTERQSIIATIPIGYADGYPRQLSSKGRVIIRGKYAPICGRICMDQFMADVTDIPGVKQGDTVTLVGRDGDSYIPIEEPADLSGSFNYEFACDIGKRVPRVYLGG